LSNQVLAPQNSSNQNNNMEQDYIYAILNKADNVVKIGFSNDPNKRLKQIQPYTIHPLQLLLTFVGDHHVERSIHEELKDYHVSAEWFKYTPEVFAVLVKFMGNQFDVKPPKPHTPTDKQAIQLKACQEFIDDLLAERMHYIKALEEAKNDLELLFSESRVALAERLGVSETFSEVDDRTFFEIVEKYVHIQEEKP